MAFFKSRKNPEKGQAQGKGEASQASLQSANGRSARDEKLERSTPGSSVNNSLNSLGGNLTPSPEQVNGRRGQSSDQSDLPLRNITVPGNQSNPNASLYPWSQRRLTYTSAHPSPFPRYGAAVNAVSSKEGDIYLMGGLIDTATVKGDLWMVEAGSGNMACYPLVTTAQGPGPRVGHASLLVGNAFIVYGGDTKMEDSDALDQTLYLLNTSTRQWSRAVPAGPRPSGRYGHSLNILGSKIYVFGGQVEGYFMNDLVAFDLNQLQVPSNRWEMLIKDGDEDVSNALVPPARTNHSMVTYNEKLYLFGGTNGFQWFNDVWSYDPTQNSWSQLDCTGYVPVPREGHAAALVDDVIYIFGGRTELGADLGDLAAFRITTHRWYTFQNMGPSPSPRSGHSMTACGKQIVVLGGEPSTVPRDAQDLALAYVLDTTKIRYPNDQQIQQSLPGERTMRRPSGSEKGAIGPSRDLASRDGSIGPDSKRLNNATPRESVMGTTGASNRSNVQPGPNGVASSSVQLQGSTQGSKLPRASMMQAPSGPPPQQQAPTPQANGAIPTNNGRGKSARPERGFGPAIDTTSAQNLNRTISPNPRESPISNRESPTGSNMNGRRTPTNQQGKTNSKASVGDQLMTESQRSDSIRSASKTRIGRQPGSLDSINENGSRNVANRPSSPPPPSRQGSNAMARKGSGRNSQTVAILKELEATKNQNAWYSSELELAKKAGYVPNPSNALILDQRAAEAFDEADRSLIEALVAMRNELANVQASIDQQAILAAKKIAEVEKQRDAAVSEAVYAKAKLAAHGGSQDSASQLENEPRDLHLVAADRSNEIAKKLATALAAQNELQNRVGLLTTEAEAEKRGRQLAEDTVNTVQQHLAELENYKRQNVPEVERLKAELHLAQAELREQTTICAEAVARAQLLQASKEDVEERHKELLDNSKDQSNALESLQEAMAASEDVKSLLERKVDEERIQREKVEEKLRKLRAEHEERTAELEMASRKLRDAEDLAEKHAVEARTHREAVLSSLDKVTARDVSDAGASSEKIAAIQAQVEAANTLVRKYQATADAASEKLRSAEERIAGLEAYQEQASRDGLAIRKQLQAAMRDSQTLQAANAEMKHQLENQQLETNAVHVQHNTLKDLLGERGISPVNAARARNLSSPQNRTDSPDLARLRDLEQQLIVSQQAHDETKQLYEARGQEAEAAYRDKLTQLENDYQSAVHYVKGTEKMIKRMKDELAKFKAENQRMKLELEEAERSSKAASETPLNWEAERESLQGTIEALQEEINGFHSQIELQLQGVRKELATSQEERGLLKQSHEQLSSLMQQAKSDLAQLQEENSLLEQRALDAEQKVSLLLDQVETSVDNYRRQSRQAGDSNGIRHLRNHSGHDSISNESIYSSLAPNLDNRNSMALDNLASELETLRAHWETTNKNYRLSNTFDFERTGRIDEEPETGTELSNSLADWRRRLEAEEHEAISRSSRKTSGELSRSPNEQSTLNIEEANVI